jgi:hypothetical protein
LSELLSPKAAVGWEAEAELIRRVEGLEAATWRSWTRRGWGMRHGVERERLWCCCSIFCIRKQEREREREGGRERCPEEKSYGKPQIKIRLMPIL